MTLDRLIYFLSCISFFFIDNVFLYFLLLREKRFKTFPLLTKLIFHFFQLAFQAYHLHMLNSTMFVIHNSDNNILFHFRNPVFWLHLNKVTLSYRFVLGIKFHRYI